MAQRLARHVAQQLAHLQSMVGSRGLRAPVDCCRRGLERHAGGKTALEAVEERLDLLEGHSGRHSQRCPLHEFQFNLKTTVCRYTEYIDTSTMKTHNEDARASPHLVIFLDLIKFVYSVQCTVHCTLYTVQYTVYSNVDCC